MNIHHNWRRAVQLVSLLAFLWLFLQTEYRGADQLAYPVSLLFRLDPLALLAALFSPGQSHLLSLWPAALLLLLTLIFGRFFCGWLCPLGTVIDLGGAPLRRKASAFAGWPAFKYYLLLALVFAAIGGLQLFGLFDPLSIFLRTLTLTINPLWNFIANGAFNWLYQADIPLVSPLADLIYPFFRDYLLSFQPLLFFLGLLTAIVFLIILALERWQPRFWCRNICPLGALFGLCARHSLLQRTPQTQCPDCALCATQCRMGAQHACPSGGTECIRCLDCLDYCPQQRVSFQFGKPTTVPFNLKRRTLLTASAGGVLLAPLMAAAPVSGRLRNDLIRPPGAVAENEFLQRCIRCGECMKVCIGNALQPDFVRGGVFSLWSPVVVARLGYCEYNCTLCGQVCPTGAIRLLPREEKRQTKIGLAVIDQNRCLPYARGEECLVCEEHCPTGKKAIVFDAKIIEQGNQRLARLQPRVVKDLCIGCGICETRCPVAGQSAIVIVSEGESRAPSWLTDRGY